MIKLNLSDDISVLSDVVAIHVEKNNICKVLAAFAVILADKEEVVEVVGCALPIFLSQGGKRYSNGFKGDGAFHYRLDEKILKTIIGILSDIVLDKKFDANHIDFELQTKTGPLGLTFRFAENFYETWLPWQR